MMLESWLARIGIFAACVALAFGLGLWRGHGWGYDSAMTHSQAVVNALTQAKIGDEATIASLKQANAAFANDAAEQQAKAQAAVRALQAQQTQSAQALGAAQRKLNEALHANQSAAAWAAARVPAGVVDQLRE